MKKEVNLKDLYPEFYEWAHKQWLCCINEGEFQTIAKFLEEKGYKIVKK